MVSQYNAQLMSLKADYSSHQTPSPFITDKCKREITTSSHIVGEVAKVATVTKPTLYNGFKIADALTVSHRVERIFFAEVYSLSDGRFLYFYPKVKPQSVPSRSRHTLIEISVAGEAYPAVLVPTHTREQLAAISEDLSTVRGLDSVAGMKDLKNLLIWDVISPLVNPEKYEKFKLSIPNGLLLYGPLGCGKTFIVKKLAEELRYHLFEMNPSSVGTPYVHGAVGNIAKVFDIARRENPAIIFIDEIEGLIPKREELGPQADVKKEEINEFLLQLNNAGADKILVVGATNRPHMIDTAILRSGRMDKRIFVPPPDFEAREEMFRLCLNGRPYNLAMDFQKLAAMTENYVGSDLELIVTKAARDAVTLDKPEIDEATVIRAIEKVTPSLSQHEIEMYGAFADMERW
jgi:AAA+ superfamily predicted ATPase